MRLFCFASDSYIIFKAMRLKIRKNKVTSLVILVLIVFSFNFFQAEVKSFFYNISSPVQSWLWNAGDNVSEFFGVIPSIRELQRENEELNLRNIDLLAELISMKQVEEENSVLRDALRLGIEKDFELETAHIIGKDLDQDSLVIDKGSADGLSKNMPVITEQKVVLGRIVEVYANCSVVMLVSDENSSFDAEVSDSGVTGLVRGEGGGRLSLGLLPKDEEVGSGELVISSALSGVFPEGLLVGSVGQVKKNDIDPFQEAGLYPFFDFADLKQVFIILDY